MRKINFYPGGQAISTDDLTFWEAYMREGFELLNANQHFVVSGCKFYYDGAISGWRLDAGTVVLGGEICKVDAKSWPATVALISPMWVRQQSTLQSQTNEDGSTNAVRVERKATIEPGLGGDVGVYQIDNVWRKVGDDAGLTSLQNSFTHDAAAPVEYKRLKNRIYLRGQAERASALATPTIIFTLPVGYRPSRIVPLPAIFNEDRLVACGITTDGWVSVIGTFTGLTSVNLDSVAFDLS